MFATRSGKARNETASDRIGNTHKHNRNRACYLLQRSYRERPIGEDNVRLAVDHLHRGLVVAAKVARGSPMRVDLNIASVDPA
jgi:hypothetical protein